MLNKLHKSGCKAVGSLFKAYVEPWVPFRNMYLWNEFIKTNIAGIQSVTEKYLGKKSSTVSIDNKNQTFKKKEGRQEIKNP